MYEIRYTYGLSRLCVDIIQYITHHDYKIRNRLASQTLILLCVYSGCVRNEINITLLPEDLFLLVSPLLF